MRVLYLLILILVTILEVGPVPITGVMLIWVVLFRPKWFFDAVMRVYGKK